jgi:drug/metabolite transporter (DMT)-like permease
LNIKNRTRMNHHSRIGYTLSVVAALVWALTSPGIKHLLDVYRVPALAIAFWRDAIIAFVCVAALLALRPSLLRVGLRNLRGFALVGAISIGVYHALWVLSIALNGAAVAIVLIYTFPAFVTFGAWLFFRERITWPQVAALLLALFGCALLVRIYDPAVLRVSWLGAVVGLATGMTHAGYVLFSQRAVQKHSPWTSLTYTMLFGALALLGMALIADAVTGETTNTQPLLLQIGPGVTPWLILAALALGPTLGGYAIFTAALRYIPGRVASLVVVLEAPIASLLAVLVLGEQLERLQIAGIACILLAVVLPQVIEYVHKRLVVARGSGDWRLGIGD